MRKTKKTATVRFQADLPASDAAFIESLKAQLGVRSNAKVLMEAATIVRWMLAEKHSGRKIASVEAGTPVRELASALIECATYAERPPYVELEWTPKQLHRAHAVLSREANEPPAALVRAVSGV